MQYSHSRIEQFNNCKYKYKLHYVDKLETITCNTADNPLLIGLLLHEAIEIGLEKSSKKYYSKFNIIDDLQINEVIKVEQLLPKIKNILPKGGYFEKQLINKDFIGFMDYIVETKPNTYDIYDFKYSNNDGNYENSRQLSLYKYYFEKNNPGKKVENLYYFMIPKVQIKQKQNEDIYSFRNRIKNSTGEPHLIKVEYDPMKVIGFLEDIKSEKETSLFPKTVSNLCNYCKYHYYCIKGDETMLLPSTERRNLSETKKHIIWIYGAPFSGKTTFANNFPNPLMLNTDGNIKFVDAPYISIANKVEMNGRIKNTQLAWDIFKEVIDELEKKDNEFKTIIIDLVEDLYEHCRLYIYKKLNIEHESDNSFKAWDIVTTEFLSTMKRLMMLDYENIVIISHEDTSKDITKKSGDKITSIRPNIREKVANKIAGMVDIVARVVANGDERTLEFKQNEVVFGGGRLTSIKDTVIPLDYEEFLKVYNQGKEEKPTRRKTEPVEEQEENVEEETKTEVVEEDAPVEEVVTRTRRRKRA
ncbi:AAA family ATPase [uncultured Parvimonas sp.]|uniref:AAA family ATPase n=1 Tax=uncultured Parvimonas sp. TaxID=747372 RepID=UPI002598B41B|nr:AAA family ATPase [uncultured Parvimonas sp.]